MELDVAADAAEAAERAAGRLAAHIAAGVGARGRAAIAVSGGATPRRMLERLAGLDLPWARVDVFQVDERIVAPDAAERNLNGLLDAFGGGSLPRERIHAMPVDADDGARAARTYAEELRAVLGADGCLDAVHLGLGKDGHTASLFPRDAALDSAADVAVTAPHQGLPRMTLTLGVLNRARARVWLVTGEAKRAVLERFLAGDPALPAVRVRREDSVVVADTAARGPASEVL